MGVLEPRSGRPRAAVLLSAAIFLGGAVAFALAPKAGLAQPLFAACVAFAVVGSVFNATMQASQVFTANFAASMLAVAFLGAAPAFLVALAGEVGGWLIERYRKPALLINVAMTAVPNLVAAAVFGLIVRRGHVSVAFGAALAAVAVCALVVNWLGVAWLVALLDGNPLRPALRAGKAFIPASAFNVAFVVIVAVVYGEYGYGAIAVLLVAIAAFGYMLQLVATARDRTKQYANLSWGVLSGLVRTLDERDSRAARHCAAVARFSRDMAAAVGMSRQEQELAHTAGLLHDIGKFTLSDRVMERGGRLTDADWRGIRRHPEIGAMLLKDLGVYGPVAEIVRAHHERIDGRGYPDRLTGEQIPELAKIVAVAEVYDTLTAPDTYRTPMNSFEALNELRRVSGSQLDERYVEVLAMLLAGRGVDYRHADEADFDAELDIERRMNEAAAP